MTIREVGLEEVWKLRHEVMWPGKELDFVKLDDDPDGLHYGLFAGETLVSVISLFLDEDGAQFRKFATLRQEQGKGYGSALLAYTLAEAVKHGAKRIWCNARATKVDFYKKFGLHETGRGFEREGVGYAILERRLSHTEEVIPS